MPVYNRIFCDTLITLTYCFVNIFVMMSGYLLCEKDFKVGRITSTWLMVWVTSVSIAISVCLIHPQGISVNGMVRSLFPILTASYWYIVSYFLLLLAAPMLNKGIEMSSEKVLRRALLWIGVLVLIFMNFNPLVDSDSYVGPDSALPWFCYMYVVGAFIRKYGVSGFNVVAILGFISFVVLFSTLYFRVSLPQGVVIHNTSSLFSVLLAVTLFVLFLKYGPSLKLPKTLMGGASLLGKSSLLVYIIQENYFFREWYWKALSPFRYKDSPKLILAWLVTVIVFWILAVIMYKWYKLLQKLFVGKIEVSINNWIEK